MLTSLFKNYWIFVSLCICVLPGEYVNGNGKLLWINSGWGWRDICCRSFMMVINKSFAWFQMAQMMSQWTVSGQKKVYNLGARLVKNQPGDWSSPCQGRPHYNYLQQRRRVTRRLIRQHASRVREAKEVI